VTSAAKSSLRRAVLARRTALDPAERARLSGLIAARVVALPAFASARTIALYAPLGAEVDTGPIARAAVACGKLLAWPRIEEGRWALGFAACAPEALVQGPRATLQPPPSAPATPPGEIDLACVPGVAFDLGLRRLGRGGGHFDATLALLSRALRVGLAYECQLVDSVPAEAHDAAVDCVVTELRVLAPRRGGG